MSELVPLRILSVEDDRGNGALLRASLARSSSPRLAGAVLVEVTGLAEARQALRLGDFDLILLDRRLPDGDGFLLAAELNSNDGQRPLIVALTADAVPATHVAALEAGCDAIMTKPYVPAQLVVVLEQQLAGRELL